MRVYQVLLKLDWWLKPAHRASSYTSKISPWPDSLVPKAGELVGQVLYLPEAIQLQNNAETIQRIVLVEVLNPDWLYSDIDWTWHERKSTSGILVSKHPNKPISLGPISILGNKDDDSLRFNGTTTPRREMFSLAPMEKDWITVCVNEKLSYSIIYYLHNEIAIRYLGEAHTIVNSKHGASFAPITYLKERPIDLTKSLF